MRKVTYRATIMNARPNLPIYGDVLYFVLGIFANGRLCLRDAKRECERLNLAYPRIEIERCERVKIRGGEIMNIIQTTEYELRTERGVTGYFNLSK